MNYSCVLVSWPGPSHSDILIWLFLGPVDRYRHCYRLSLCVCISMKKQSVLVLLTRLAAFCHQMVAWCDCSCGLYTKSAPTIWLPLIESRMAADAEHRLTISAKARDLLDCSYGKCKAPPLPTILMVFLVFIGCFVGTIFFITYFILTVHPSIERKLTSLTVYFAVGMFSSRTWRLFTRSTPLPCTHTCLYIV